MTLLTASPVILDSHAASGPVEYLRVALVFAFFAATALVVVWVVAGRAARAMSSSRMGARAREHTPER